nr:pleckstrin homology-like domain family B member 3 isoform X1 [Pogona vitticeps]XP_020668466.1 pleckstrin homology-like domain family B member 3 isoform X1 [Pogona vitticeps]XP_020668467.1 pleckstrin homology-like domain family B member 3 isoform X1 [Pogona vitticeps]XP_020668469.1 pleckstrin homology-like domain family B member 3 isoform X1 [Pogona vitticeps]
MVLQNADGMGVLSQSELCPCPAPLEKDHLEEASKGHRSPERDGSLTQIGTEGDSLSSGRGSSPGGNSSRCTEEDEASSTESAQHGHESPCAGRNGSPSKAENQQQPLTLSKISVLENRIKELHHQKKELSIEMDLEGALLEGELKEERQEMRREEEQLLELQRRLAETERRCQAEREKEKARLQQERRKVEELQRQHAETQIHLDNQPESMRERMQSQLQETSEMLEGALRCYEDLEFQQLERESRLEEEKEAACRALAEEIAQLQNSINQRKRTVQRLEGQARLTQEQMVDEGQRFAQEKGEAVRNLNVEKSRFMDMGQEYLERSGEGPTEDKQGVTQLTFTQKMDQKVIVLGSDKSDSSSCVFSVRSSVKGSIGLQRTASLPRRRGDRLPPRSAQRPLSMHGALDPSILAAQLSGGNNGHYLGSPNLQFARLNNPLYQLLGGQGAVGQLGGNTQGAYSNLGNCVTKLAEMERRVMEAMAERERLLQEREAKKAAEEAKQMELPSSNKNPVESPEAKPIMFDLRKHLEASGHSVDTCPHVRVTSKSCKGYLVKMGGRIKTWKKRWFTFDRLKRVLAYYADKEETKLKGVIYFQAIEEVYYDHLRSAFKSPSPKMTFCVKTYDRLFCMVAPSPEAMRIWMDAIVTAAEENARY